MRVSSLTWVWAAALSILFSHMALAQHRTDAQGSLTTGGPFEVIYPGYVTGIFIRQHNHVEAISAYYAQVDANGGIGPSQLGRGAGGPGGYDGPPGVEKTFRCPVGAIVVGLRIATFNSMVGNVEMLCENLTTGFRAYVKTDWVQPAEGGCSAPFGCFTGAQPIYQGESMNCPQGHAAVGFHGRSGLIIDALGLVCKKLPSAEAAAPPPPVTVPGGSTEFTIREVGKKRRCNDYGTRAVALKEQAARCGLTGARFDASYDDHFSFCMNNSRARADEEDKARTDTLAACGANAGNDKDAYCKNYAQEAFAQSAKARNAPLKCGLNGPRYDSTYWQHFGWCQQVPQSMAEAEIRARELEMKACVSCRDWTARTLDQFIRAQSCARALPWSEPRWRANSTEGHFRACFMAQPGGLFGVNGTTAQQAIARDGDLAACR